MSLPLIQHYHAQVEQLIRYGGTRNESTLRKPFQDLLEHYARAQGLLLVPEVEFTTAAGRKLYPDGTLKDALRQDWGYWESKDEKDDLAAEITAKFARGYPRTNILFEDTQTAVLYQNGSEVARAVFTNAPALHALLTQFVSYEPTEVREFHKALALFSAEVPRLAATLRTVIEDQFRTAPAFQKAITEFLTLCRQTINPKIELADVREMVIQHVLTEDIFMRVFAAAEFHRENVIAHKLTEVANTFYKGAVKHQLQAKIAPYYAAINARAAQISDHHEKQKFLKALYENFYQAYNPQAADRLGIVYTPDEIVRFMIESADHLTFQHFGKTLGDENVEILDPATGTGTFITELIEYLPPAQLPYKYAHEIHCNEVAILPYYIANLNIEYTYQQKTGQYAAFENICFVDTLDNLGFEKAYENQTHFLGLVDGNIERINRQNERKISVVIGNPPYNANQLNENDNNKNRAYPEIDRRIKNTYIKHSTAQKTKLYDMYTRFLRWASDRLDHNGIIAFVSNNSFLDARSYDGFRKVVAQEFNEIYVLDLKGDARTSGERRRQEGGNVFSDKIRVGVAIYFLVRRKGAKGCRLYYHAVPDHATAEDKKAFLREHKLADLPFRRLQPDADHNWLNLTDNDWEKLLPLGSKAAKTQRGGGEPKAIFQLVTPGIVTARDEWVYDFGLPTLKQKSRFLIRVYNQQIKALRGKNFAQIGKLADYSIKWSEALKRNVMQGKTLAFQTAQVTRLGYRPFVNVFYYSAKELSDRLTANHYAMFGEDWRQKNILIAVNISERLFNVLASDKVVDLHFNGDSQCFPLYRYAEDGTRVDNITDWALGQFQKRYKDPAITKEAIFHYVYAVLHHPAYRAKYAPNLKRDFPHIPFYKNFGQWAAWGQQLLELHLNYEQAKPYPLETHTRKGARAGEVAPRLQARKAEGLIEVDTVTTLSGVPAQAWEYRLGTYSALEWVLERYKEKTPKDPTIREQFNTYRLADYKELVMDLLRRVCTVSVETLNILAQMPEA